MNKNNNNIIMGLDVSTKTIGICLLEDDGSQYGKILELTHINPKIPKKIKGIEQLFLKKKIFEDFLMKYKNFGIDYVIIEEPLLSSNNSNTVSTLLRFNGIISDCIYNTLGIVPMYISSYDARKYSFPELMAIRKYGKDEKQYPYQKIYNEIKKCNLVLFGSYPWTIDKKMVLQQKVADIFPNIQWLYNKNGELKKENFDGSDAYIALLGWLNKERYGELNFTSEIIGEACDGKGTREISYIIKYWDKEDVRKTYAQIKQKNEAQ